MLERVCSYLEITKTQLKRRINTREKKNVNHWTRRDIMISIGNKSNRKQRKNVTEVSTSWESNISSKEQPYRKTLLTSLSKEKTAKLS